MRNDHDLQMRVRRVRAGAGSSKGKGGRERKRIFRVVQFQLDLLSQSSHLRRRLCHIISSPAFNLHLFTVVLQQSSYLPVQQLSNK